MVPKFLFIRCDHWQLYISNSKLYQNASFCMQKFRNFASVVLRSPGKRRRRAPGLENRKLATLDMTDVTFVLSRPYSSRVRLSPATYQQETRTTSQRVSKCGQKLEIRLWGLFQRVGLWRFDSTCQQNLGKKFELEIRQRSSLR